MQMDELLLATKNASFVGCAATQFTLPCLSHRCSGLAGAAPFTVAFHSMTVSSTPPETTCFPLRKKQTAQAAAACACGNTVVLLSCRQDDSTMLPSPTAVATVFPSREKSTQCARGGLAFTPGAAVNLSRARHFFLCTSHATIVLSRELLNREVLVDGCHFTELQICSS